MESIFVIIGDIIGAGFASGQEINVFFYQHGINGIFGIIICSILICFVIYKSLMIILYDKVNNKPIETYKQFLESVFNKKNSIVKIMNWIINISLLISFYIMISGFGAYFEQEFGINNIIGALILAFISFILFMTNVKGIAKANSIVVPLLIICITIIGIKNFMQIDLEMIGQNLGNTKKSENRWIWDSIIYCSYNMILLIPVLVSLKDFIKNKKQIILISIFSGLMIFILAISIYLLLARVDINIETIGMPAVYVIRNNFLEFRSIYGIVILGSIFSTAISVGIGFLENVVKNKRYFPQIAGIMCIAGVIVSNFGFSNLVKISFPIIGYLGIVQIFCVMKTKM